VGTSSPKSISGKRGRLSAVAAGVGARSVSLIGGAAPLILVSPTSGSG
jgi:hypothetical protein